MLKDGEVNVAFKTVEGRVDRAAGIVWRYQDPNNYYIARANAEDRTFQGAGKTGLWTKADSATYFDEFTIVKK